jgi:TolB-like protein
MRSLFPALVLGLWLTGCQLFSGGAPWASQPERPADTPLPPPPRVAEPPAPRAKPLLIMLDLNPSGVDRESAHVISQRLWNELFRSNEFLMIPRDVTRRLLAERRLAVEDPFRPTLSMRRVGEALTADYLVFGEVGRIGETFAIDVNLLDVDEGQVTGAGALTASGGLENLLPRIPMLTREILAEWANAPRIITVPTPQRRLPPARQPNVTALVGPPPVDPTPQPVTTQSSVDLAPPPVPPEPEPAVVIPPEPEVTPPAPEPEPELEPEPSVASAVEVLPPPPPEPEPVPEPEVEPEPQHSPSLVASETQEVEPAPLPPEVPEEPPVFTVAPDSEPDPEDTLDSQIAAARTQLRRRVAAAESPHGTEIVDASRAEVIKNQVAQYPPDSPLRAELLEEGLELNPLNPGLLAHSARTHLVEGNTGMAIDECLMALNLEPNDSVVLTVLGSIHHNRSEYLEAVAAQELALEVDPSNHYAQYNLGLSLWQIDPEEARPALERYIILAERLPDQEVYVERAREQLARLD